MFLSDLRIHRANEYKNGTHPLCQICRTECINVKLCQHFFARSDQFLYVTDAQIASTEIKQF